jgi:hypothetical protein
MPASYKIVLTPLAKAAAEKYGSAAGLEAEARAQSGFYLRTKRPTQI